MTFGDNLIHPKMMWSDMHISDTRCMNGNGSYRLTSSFPQLTWSLLKRCLSLNRSAISRLCISGDGAGVGMLYTGYHGLTGNGSLSACMTLPAFLAPSLCRPCVGANFRDAWTILVDHEHSMRPWTDQKQPCWRCRRVRVYVLSHLL